MSEEIADSGTLMDGQGEAGASVVTNDAGATVNTEVVATEGTPAPSYLNTDGTLKEGWEEIVPDEFKGRPVYKAIGKDLKSILTHIGHQDRVISKQGKGVFPPGADATPTDIQMFHKAIGVPDTPDGYKFEPPAELKEFYSDQELIDTAKAEMHKAGMTPQQFAVVMALDAQRMNQSVKEMQENPLPFYEEILPLVQPKLAEIAQKELRSKWGDAYDTRLQLANIAIAENTAEGDERERLLQRVGNDPLIADFLATVQLKHHVEANGPDTSMGQGATKMNVQQRIDEISGQLTEQLRRGNRQKYDALLSEKSRLYSVMNPE